MTPRSRWIWLTALAAVLAFAAAPHQGANAQGRGTPPPPDVEPAAPTGDPSTIKPAPAFTVKDLTTAPTDGWVTNGGTVFNQRYSPLDQINKSNIGQVKALWRTGMASGLRQDQSGQAQILVYGDSLYVINGADDVFAMDVESGKILWNYSPKPDPHAGAPSGHSSRGVAIGEGKVFIGTLDDRMIALDQKTGKVVWSVQAERWQDRFAITSAPLYYNGLVITGFNGGEEGVRGRVKAFDAKDGHLVWTFYTVPAPGDRGSQTWPKGSDAWMHGGATVWQTPAVDPKLGLIYFSTGNPGPDYTGVMRAGDNLYAESIVALDAKTGKYRWHFQEIHHDLWDYDASNPVILFDAPYKGKLRHAIAQAGKTGFTYILDRVTGKPLLGIPEKAVPQEPTQATAKTQPYPIGDAFVPQEILIPPEDARLEPGTTHLPNYGRIFTPGSDDARVLLKPSTNGGANWPPSSYDPTTHLLYVCASDRSSSFGGRRGVGTGAAASTTPGGILAAIDVTANKLKWRQEWREICFSGSVVTKGGLLLVGRADGRLIAYDKTNGQSLWEFLTDAGVNTTATTFMHNGKQRIVVQAGGGTFANGKRGDGIWMFGLDGTINTLAPPPRQFGGGGGGGPPGGGAARPAATPAR